MSKFFIKLKSGYLYEFHNYRNVKVRVYKYTKRVKIRKPGPKYGLYRNKEAKKYILSVEIQEKQKTRYHQIEVLMNTIKDMNIDLKKK